MEAFEKEFPVRLEFFRKRVNNFLQVTGKAFIVEDTAVFMDDWGDIAPVYKENILRQLVLVRVKMMRVEYYDNPTADNKFWWNNFAEKIQQWFFHTWQWGKPYEIKPKHIAASISA